MENNSFSESLVRVAQKFKDLKDQKYVQLMIAIMDNDKTLVKDLSSGIILDNNNHYNECIIFKDSNPKLYESVTNDLKLINNLIKRIDLEVDRQPYDKSYMIKMCEALFIVYKRVKRIITKKSPGMLERIRNMSGWLKKIFLGVGIAGSLSFANPKSVTPIEGNIPLSNNSNNSSSLFINNPNNISGLESLNKNNNMVSNEIIATTEQQLGKRYVWGAVGPNTFDCSGLIKYVYGQHGIDMPRVSKEQSKVGDLLCSGTIDTTKLMPGDLLFFGRPGVKGVGHVGIYVGSKIDKDGNLKVMMIHAPGKGKNVRYEDVNKNYWKNKFISGRRVLGVNQLYASR